MLRKSRILVLVLVLGILACGGSDESDQLVRTLVEPTAEAGATPAESAEQPTAIPTEVPPTPTPEIEGLVSEGTHIVGTDIEPGVYVGMAGTEFGDTCYWERLSGLTGNLDDILANGNAKGRYYVEVLPTDMALQTGCELLPIDQVPAPAEFETALGPGMYIVGRDIQEGLYRGEAGTDFSDSCYWARLSGLAGGLNTILANGNETGQFFIQVLATDVALDVGCDVAWVNP